MAGHNGHPTHPPPAVGTRKPPLGQARCPHCAPIRFPGCPPATAPVSRSASTTRWAPPPAHSPSPRSCRCSHAKGVGHPCPWSTTRLDPAPQKWRLCGPIAPSPAFPWPAGLRQRGAHPVARRALGTARPRHALDAPATARDQGWAPRRPFLPP